MANRTEVRDVVVVGSGLAGLAAAYEAKKAGADVVILEKMKTYGGNSVLSGGGFACWDSKLKLREALSLGEDSWQLHAEDTIRSGKGKSIPALVELMAQRAPEALDWLIDIGVPFKNMLARLGGYSVARSYQTDCSGKQFMDIVKKAVETAGVSIYLNCRVDAILTEDGAVSGVQCSMDGEALEITAKKAVILASGGFAANVAMRETYSGIGSEYNCSNHPGATGEMIERAVELGAEVLNMAEIQLFPCANPKSGMVDPWALISYSAAGVGALYVSSEGRRFVNELEGRDTVSDAQIKRCSKPTWAIVSAQMVEDISWPQETAERGVRLGRAKRADTIEDLARELGIDSNTLGETIAESNAAIAAKQRDALGRPYSDMFRCLTDGPFYAIAQWPSVHYTMGGLLTDTESRVLRADGSAIPRLYAAGEICGGVHGANRLGGNALTECLVFGQIAGRNAAKE